MRKAIAIIGISSTFIIISCSPRLTPAGKKAGNSDATDIKITYTEAQLQEGKTIMEQSCKECHELHRPADYSLSTWKSILPKMCRKAKLDMDEAGLVKAYIVANARS